MRPPRGCSLGISLRAPRRSGVLASINFMSDDRILAIDIGAGTMDVLLYDPAQPMENAVQLVLPSATAIAGKKIASYGAMRSPKSATKSSAKKATRPMANQGSMRRI